MGASNEDTCFCYAAYGARNGRRTFNSKVQKELERLNQGLDMALYMARLNNFHEDFHVETISLKDTVTKILTD